MCAYIHTGLQDVGSVLKCVCSIHTGIRTGCVEYVQMCAYTHTVRLISNGYKCSAKDGPLH